MNLLDTRISKAVKSAHAITCAGHKIYISADPEMTADFIEHGYSITLIKSKTELDAARTLQEWYDVSGPLRFITKVRSPGENSDYINVISQFDEQEDDEEEY